MADDSAATTSQPQPQPQTNPPPQTTSTTSPFPPQNQQPPSQPHPSLNPDKDKIMASDSAANTPGADSAAATPSATTQVRPGGAPIRRYMNEKIVPHLLDGMTVVAKEQPPNPLRVLGEYLIQKSNEVEQQGVSKTPE
ncbi:COMPASS (complex proteins associated with Set1p) component [Aspergillus niger]